MTDLNSFIDATLDASRARFDGNEGGAQSTLRASALQLLIPIRSLGENHRGRIAQHLHDLSENDRYLRFGYVAQDAQITKYVEDLDFDRDEIFGIYNRRLQLIAAAHLAFPDSAEHSQCAEFGVSVSASVRGRGFGARLFERAALSASNAGVKLMFIHALTENAAMLSIARKAGAHVERDGPESEAYLKLPSSSFDSVMAEVIGEQLAQLDYQFKVQAKQFWEFLSDRAKDGAR